MNRKNSIVSLLAVLVLSACVQPEVPPDRFYRIVPPPPQPLAAPLLRGTLEVDRPAANGLVANRAIVYADSARPNELEAYSYRFWAEPPALMLRDELVRYLRAAGVAEAVVTADMRLDADYVLISRLKRLERVVGADPRVEVEMDISLRDNRRDRLVFQRIYRDSVAPSDDSISAAVDAINAAFADFCARLVTDLGGV